MSRDPIPSAEESLASIDQQLKDISETLENLTLAITTFLKAYKKILSQQGLIV